MTQVTSILEDIFNMASLVPRIAQVIMSTSMAIMSTSMVTTIMINMITILSLKGWGVHLLGERAAAPRAERDEGGAHHQTHPRHRAGGHDHDGDHGGVDDEDGDNSQDISSDVDILADPMYVLIVPISGKPSDFDVHEVLLLVDRVSQRHNVLFPQLGPPAHSR